MKEFEFSVDTVKELMDKMAKTHLGTLEIKMGDVSIKMEAKQPAAAPMVIPTADMPHSAPMTMASSAEETELAAEPAEGSKNTVAAGNVVNAPIVGTFYSAPAPDKESFVKLGQKVKKGDVLFIIESMKLMNEVQSDYDGVVSQIFVKSGEGVEYGQPIMIIE